MISTKVYILEAGVKSNQKLDFFDMSFPDIILKTTSEPGKNVIPVESIEIEQTIKQGGVAIGIILALTLLVRALAMLVKASQN